MVGVCELEDGLQTPVDKTVIKRALVSKAYEFSEIDECVIRATFLRLFEGFAPRARFNHKLSVKYARKPLLELYFSYYACAVDVI